MMSVCEERRAVRIKLEDLRFALCEARAERERAKRETKEKCRAGRLAARERARAERIRLKRELADKIRAELAAVKAACAERRAAARAAESEVERARLAYRAEVQNQREQHKAAKNAEAQRRGATEPARAESDEDVRARIARELVPLFDLVAKKIRPGPHESRTEAFLRYAEKHPDQVLVAANDPAEARVRALEEEHRQVTEEAGARPSRKGNAKKGDAKKKIVLHDIKRRDIVRRGQMIVGERMMGKHAEIVVGESIRIFGIDGKTRFDLTFRIGDEAAYGGYNLTYTGKIVSIGEKTIAIQPSRRESIHRLDVADFTNWNWDFDAEKIAARNADTLLHI